ncbi:MAG: ATP-dependent 6-phosphofructokinase [Planctomycetota bacterium]|nr:ATP-dependent 6-phosphofructokinase [Planctomycetota bacterium]
MKIGVFCSGGDAPGMNACVRAVVRTAISEGHAVVGIRSGYDGVIDGDYFINSEGLPHMTLRSVSGWSKEGGAFLRSSRSDRFRTVEGRQAAAEMLKRNGIDALIPIGGNGTLTGAIEFSKVWDGQIVGCPGTIDNDLGGTDYTIGFSTAVQTAVDAIDKIRDTAESHERMFLIEVMGRHSGYIAVHAALACGAEVAAIPETPTEIGKIVDYLKLLKSRGKGSIMMIVAEGDEVGDAARINQLLAEQGCPFSTRIVVLGHLQRGGGPSPGDRVRATQMGSAAVRAILDGQQGVMVGVRGEATIATPFTEVIQAHRPIPRHLVDLLATMAS